MAMSGMPMRRRRVVAAPPAPTPAVEEASKVLSRRIDGVASELVDIQAGRHIMTAECVVNGLPYYAALPQTVAELRTLQLGKLEAGTRYHVSNPQKYGPAGGIFMQLHICDAEYGEVVTYSVPCGLGENEGGKISDVVGKDAPEIFFQGYSL